MLYETDTYVPETVDADLTLVTETMLPAEETAEMEILPDQ